MNEYIGMARWELRIFIKLSLGVTFPLAELINFLTRDQKVLSFSTFLLCAHWTRWLVCHDLALWRSLNLAQLKKGWVYPFYYLKIPLRFRAHVMSQKWWNTYSLFLCFSLMCFIWEWKSGNVSVLMSAKDLIGKGAESICFPSLIEKGLGSSIFQIT